MKINILSEELINQIAAGEVIEDYSSVIKELIENSIDANANNIEIHLNNELKKIIVKDNGIGIPKEEICKAPLRNATSKIRDIKDLYSIKSLGFRGEALASIFSVSKAKLYSRTKQEKFGYEITYKNYKENNPKKVEGEYGTKVIVEDLFYNVPARKKYLKSYITEYKNILKIIKSYSIINYKISFKVLKDNEVVFYKPSFKTLKENINYIFKSIKDDIIEINENIKNLKLTAYLSKEKTFLNKNNQYFFINNRYIKSKLLQKAVYDAYDNLMGKHPFIVLNLNLDPEIIDVNIHPKKMEVKFENELFIYNEIRKTIKKEIFNKRTIKEINLQKKLYEINNIKNNNTINNNNKIRDSYENKYFTKEYQKNLATSLNLQSPAKTYNKLNELDEIYNYNYSTKIEHKDNNNKLKEIEKKYNEIQRNYEKGPFYELFKEYKLLGQFNKTYILVENKEGLFIIDQHIVEEKYNFEQILKKISYKQNKLIKEKKIPLNAIEKATLLENIKFLKEIGFEFEIKNNTLILKKIPIYFGKEIGFEYIKDTIKEEMNKEDFEKEIYNKIATISCKSSIKAGTELTNYEMKKIIEKLRYIKDPYSCPHGRPIVLKLNIKEIEKYFKRII